jgi:DNA ligase (NAD+)
MIAHYHDDLDTINTLKSSLMTAAKAYYQELGDSGMTDEEYDESIEYLRTLSKRYAINDPELHDLLEGAVAAGTTVTPTVQHVHHDVPMLSLEKAKTRDAVENYLNRMVKAGATGFKLQAKLDGIACSAVYHDGILSSMSTRGNGTDGEDVSYLISSNEITIQGLPGHLSHPISVEVRGELFLRPSDYRDADDNRMKATGSRFSNYRNANAGIIRKAAKGLGYNARLSFILYKIVGDATEAQLHEAGIDTITDATTREWNATNDPCPSSLTVEGDDLIDKTMSIVDMFGPVRPLLDIPTDGIVIKPVNEREMDEKLGSNNEHPLSQIAFKYPGAKARVKITGVEWTVGKTGRITPVLNYEPTEFGGSINSNATLHNTGTMNAYDIRIGSIAIVEKANDVIPYFKGIVYSDDQSPRITPPTVCPSCGSKLDAGDKLTYCNNPDCPSKNAYVLRAAVSKKLLNFDGMSIKYLDALHASGKVNDIADFYDLTEQDLANTSLGTTDKGTERHIGVQNARHIIGYINASKELPYYKVMAALAIKDLGLRTSRLLAKHYHSIDEIAGTSEDELSSIDGIGPIRAHNIIVGLDSHKTLIDRLKDTGLRMDDHDENDDAEAEEPSTQDNAITGKRFSISGSVPEGYANRTTWQEHIESMGGIAQSAPNKDTDYMIGDPSSSSSKIKKALKLGVPVISPDDFNMMTL